MNKLKQTLSLQKLLLGYIATPSNKILRKMRLKKQGNLFPSTISDYKFVKKTSSTYHNFQIALYKNKKGKRAIAKAWSGYIKDYEYFTLENEVNLYKIFTSVFVRVGKKNPSNIKNVTFPKLIDVYQDEKSLILLIEYIKGKSGLNMNTEKKYEIYYKVVEYLRFLGNNMNADEKQQVGKRSLSSMVFLYPAIVLAALCTNTGAWRKIMQSIPRFIQALPSALSSYENQLIHRDFHFDNVILNGRKIYVIDFQFSLFSLWLVDVATMLRFVWKDKKFVLKILNDSNINISKLNRNNLFWLLSMHSATHGLTDKTLSKEEKINRIKYLDFSVNKNSSI